MQTFFVIGAAPTVLQIQKDLGISFAAAKILRWNIQPASVLQEECEYRDRGKDREGYDVWACNRCDRKIHTHSDFFNLPNCLDNFCSKCGRKIKKEKNNENI